MSRNVGVTVTITILHTPVIAVSDILPLAVGQSGWLDLFTS